MPSASSRSLLRCKALFTALALAVCLLAGFLGTTAKAYAAEDSECVLSTEDAARFEADGSLEARTRYMESLGNGRFDDHLVKRALAREQGMAALSSVLPDWKAGMPTVGTANIVLVCVDFPDKPFEEPAHVQLLEQVAFGGAPAASFPYESLAAYYQRSSYGKLEIASPLPSGSRAFEYSAQYERSHYSGNPSALLEETLAALEDSTDLTAFDGNADGIIDAVYLHFAGGDEGWGSTWWPQEDIYRGGKTVDGMGIGNFVLLSSVGSTMGDGALTQDALRVLIHETGHVLGLPDYYQAQGMPPSPTGRSGILTFDMMMNNAGDQNGFSKWVLGWLDDDAVGDDAHVTRVIANDDGIVVKEGDVVVATYDADAAEEFDLGSLTALGDPTATGGIIVASNEDAGLFSEYFLIQYDTFAQNQSIHLGTSEPLPSGFRMFHVNAVLNEGKTNFAHSNFEGSVYDQLIEMVDPDMGKPHAGIDVPQAIDGGFHCMLFTGDTVSPSTFPSSNYAESPATGFTGLTFQVTASGGIGLPSDSGGSLLIRYSPAGKPTSDTFTLTPVSGFTEANNAGRFVLSASFTPSFPQVKESAPYLQVDGRQVPVNAAIDNTDPLSPKVTVDYRVFKTVMQADSSCELVFPAGVFVCGVSDGVQELSKEMRFAVQPGAITRIDRMGSWSGDADMQWSGASSNNWVASEDLSNLVPMGGTQVAFFQWRVDGVYLYPIETRDCSVVAPTRTEETPYRVVAHDENFESPRVNSLQAVALDDGSFGLLRTSENRNTGTARTFLYHVYPDGRLDFMHEATGMLNSYSLAACGEYLMLYGNSWVSPTGMGAFLFDTAEASEPSHLLALPYDKVFNVASGELAAVQLDAMAATECSIDLFDQAAFAAAVEAVRESEANAGIDSFRKLAKRSIVLPGWSNVHGAGSQGSDLVAVMAGEARDPMTMLRPLSLVRIDAQGAVAEHPLGVDKDMHVGALDADALAIAVGLSMPASSGSAFSPAIVAHSGGSDSSSGPATLWNLASSGGPAYLATGFHDAGLDGLSAFHFPGGRDGIWVEGSYFAIGAATGEGLFYWKTASFVQPDDPDDPLGPSPAPAALEGGAGLVRTGDVGAPGALAVASLALVTLVVLAWVRATRRTG